MTSNNITANFEYLGVPLKNKRWSWGASNEDVVVLRVWQDHRRKGPAKTMTTRIWHREWKVTPGLNERKKHIAEIEAGKACYAIVVRDENLGTGKDRKIAKSPNRAIFLCGSVIHEDDEIRIELVKRFKDLADAKNSLDT